MRQRTYEGEFSPAVVFSWILVAALATYYNAFRNAFKLDDFHIAVINPWVHSLKNIPRFFIDPFTFSSKIQLKR